MSDITQSQIERMVDNCFNLIEGDIFGIENEGAFTSTMDDKIKTSIRVSFRAALTERHQHIKRIEELEEALAEVEGCFEAAEIEGLSSVLSAEENKNTGSLHDLVTRRLMYALYAAQALSTNEDKG